jgi:hypothetical protein
MKLPKRLLTMVGSIADERQQYCRRTSAVLSTNVGNRKGSTKNEKETEMRRVLIHFVSKKVPADLASPFLFITFAGGELFTNN